MDQGLKAYSIMKMAPCGIYVLSLNKILCGNGLKMSVGYLMMLLIYFFKLFKIPFNRKWLPFSLLTKLICRAHGLFTLADGSGPPPIHTDFQSSWFMSG